VEATLTVLSPHRDDAVFSLFLTLSNWANWPLELQVLNFFTISSYAPWSRPESMAAISAVRAREDRKAIKLTSNNIRVHSLDLLDAPQRLNIGLNEITSAEISGRLSQDELQFLAKQIVRYCGCGLVLAPLALGGHVDHLAVHKAALLGLAPHRIGFYEDLPYATWTLENEIKARIQAIAADTKTRLRAEVIRSKQPSRMKLRTAALYRSQITREQAQAIARFAYNYRGGERLWLPPHSSRWNLIRSLARALPRRATRSQST
jgi:LmbE family N-acetylglucosaminyl deacetylase